MESRVHRTKKEPFVKKHSNDIMFMSLFTGTTVASYIANKFYLGTEYKNRKSITVYDGIFLISIICLTISISKTVRDYDHYKKEL